MARMAGDPRVALAKKLAAARSAVAAVENEVAGLGDAAPLVTELARLMGTPGTPGTATVKTERAVATSAPAPRAVSKAAGAKKGKPAKKKVADDDDMPL